MRTGTVGRLQSGPPALGLALLLCGCHPAIPHRIAAINSDYCQRCHVGRAGAPRSGHRNMRDTCTACHKILVWGLYPALMPHRGGNESACSLCHQRGALGAKPVGHLGEAGCYSCHQARDYGDWPPAMPHELGVWQGGPCRSCHIDLKHGEQPSCATCHRS